MSGATNWNSLEVAKLIVGTLTPLSVALIGIWFARATKRLEGRQWVNQKLVEKRIGIFEEALPALNDLYCYFSWIGIWKELSPPDIVQRKRTLDRIFYANRSFLSADVVSDYEAFIALLFKIYTAPGIDARLRTGKTSHDGDRETSYSGAWLPEWTPMFVAEPDRSSRSAIQSAYDALVNRLAADVGADTRQRDGNG